MTKPGSGAYYFDELIKINELEIPLQHKLSRLYVLLNSLFVQYTKNENLQFTTSFARVSYTCQKLKIDQNLQWRIYHFRKLCQDVFFEGRELNTDQYRAGIKVFSECIHHLLEVDIPLSITQLYPEQQVFKRPERKIISFKDFARVVVLGRSDNDQYLIGRDEDEPDIGLIQINTSASESAEFCSRELEAIEKLWSGNIIVNLLEVDIDANGIYTPPNDRPSAGSPGRCNGNSRNIPKLIHRTQAVSAAEVPAIPNKCSNHVGSYREFLS